MNPYNSSLMYDLAKDRMEHDQRVAARARRQPDVTGARFAQRLSLGLVGALVAAKSALGSALALHTWHG